MDSVGIDLSEKDFAVCDHRRAQAAADYLISKGVADLRVGVMGKGETMPIADNGTREGRAKNRRVEIDVKL